MKKFTSVTIIYNPKSTGDGEKLAKKLKADLKQKGFLQKVLLKATEHAGHAEDIAYKQAMSSTRALIISSSGDGGYNEVVNGIMKAQSEGASPVAGLLPAGNANDHFKNIYKNDSTTSILKHSTQCIDLLSLEPTKNKKSFQKYAHSYIGIGLTPKLGEQLNQTKLNRINEIIISFKNLLLFEPVDIKHHEAVYSYYSIVAANIKTMSKVLELSKDTSVSDGRFELITFEKTNKRKLFIILLKSAILGLKTEKSVKKFSFKTIEPTLIQLDGEVYKLDSNSDVKVAIKRQKLECLL